MASFLKHSCPRRVKLLQDPSQLSAESPFYPEFKDFDPVCFSSGRGPKSYFCFLRRHMNSGSWTVRMIRGKKQAIKHTLLWLTGKGRSRSWCLPSRIFLFLLFLRKFKTRVTALLQGFGLFGWFFNINYKTNLNYSVVSNIFWACEGFWVGKI